CVAAVLAASAAPAGEASRRRWQPRWWWGAAAAAVLVVTVSRPWRADLPQRAADSTATPGSATPASPVGAISEDAAGNVHFELALPRQAAAVSIVGDFNGWDAKATPMTRDGGEWSAKVALPPGRHVYAFVVDGATWVVDPMAPQVPDAGYGPTNAVIVDPR
ncbi:MAG: isoamylase early set domain-containing protein, partial [Gemmatimonadaceae bacterium]|nr:isoamylase early set domain-containing protein [Gemmatimonadaceae bacterium]